MTVIHKVNRRPLSDFVDFLWLSAGYVQPHAAERVLPTGNMSLILDLDEHGKVPDALSGARTRSFVLDTSTPLSLIGVVFKPGGGFPFVAGPAAELQDLSIPLDAIWGRGAQVLRERVLEARTARGRLQRLEQFLFQLALRRPQRHPAVAYALKTLRSPGSNVADVTERTGLSARRFIELFRREVGLTPKMFSRLSRFRAVVSTLQPHAAVDWTTIALDCGYYDQAHFIHDFREFAGMSPSAYLRHRTAGPNHVRVTD
ncbi:MAG TPA: helix-turn-helix domain-containing protein [Steroidobacteraceae bacterium]|jgi:AraC-like DNA-binding protein|nr:helix-turn-helix domain-containing protein [Steroidobacteraceae bacterium]